MKITKPGSASKRGRPRRQRQERHEALSINLSGAYTEFRRLVGLLSEVEQAEWGAARARQLANYERRREPIALPTPTADDQLLDRWSALLTAVRVA